MKRLLLAMMIACFAIASSTAQVTVTKAETTTVVKPKKVTTVKKTVKKDSTKFGTRPAATTNK